MANSASWAKIFRDYEIEKHNFDSGPFPITADMIKKACQRFKETSKKEVRILCKQDTRDSRPQVFKKNGLFLLPTRNGQYAIVKGEGYVDIPAIQSDPIVYHSALDFKLESSDIGDSEMQHLDFAYASSLVRTFVEDPSLLLTIRGRKYTPDFSLNVGNIQIAVSGVQTEVDAGYEGRDQIVLIEAKNSEVSDTIIRQLYYPYRQWKSQTTKDVTLLFFDKGHDGIYNIWQFGFRDELDYNSIYLIKSGRYIIEGPNSV